MLCQQKVLVQQMPNLWHPCLCPCHVIQSFNDPEEGFVQRNGNKMLVISIFSFHQNNVLYPIINDKAYYFSQLRFVIYKCLKFRTFYNFVVCLTHYHTMPHFDALKICRCGKHCKKRSNWFIYHNVFYPIGHFFHSKCI